MVFTDFFKMKGGMMRIKFEKREIFVCQFLDTLGKRTIALPKLGRSKMFQSSLVLPLLCAASACLANFSSLPERISLLICSSQSSESYLRNQFRKAARPE